MARSLYSKFVLGYLIFGYNPGLSDQGPGKCPLR